MFKHIFQNRLKILVRNKTVIFWTLLFPIALGTFFNLAFSGLGQAESFDTIDIAIINNENYNNDTSFKSMMDGLSAGENKIFNITYTDLEKAKTLLNDEKIKGYIEDNDKIEITVLENGIESTIIKTVVDEYNADYSAVSNIAKINPNIMINDIVKSISEKKYYFKDISNSNVDVTVIYFYTLIGMVCLYGSFFGVNTVNETEANLTKQGARVTVSPTKKSKILITSLLVAFIVQYVEVLITMAYLVFVLGVSFGNQLLYILILTAAGSLAGITIGALVGAASKSSLNSKMGILLAVTMTCSFLSGMMVVEMKYWIAANAPILAKINPITLITDGLYSLYYYTTYDRFFENVISLLIFSGVMSILTFLCMRRKKYDSI